MTELLRWWAEEQICFNLCGFRFQDPMSVYSHSSRGWLCFSGCFETSTWPVVCNCWGSGRLWSDPVSHGPARTCWPLVACGPRQSEPASWRLDWLTPCSGQCWRTNERCQILRLLLQTRAEENKMDEIVWCVRLWVSIWDSPGRMKSCRFSARMVRC